MLSALAAEDDLGTGRLTAVPAEGVKLTRSLRAIWPGGRPLPVLAQRLLTIATA